MNSALQSWSKKGTKLVQVDAVNTRTASIANEWVPVKPGTESILALGIASYLIKKKQMASSGSDFAKWSSILINQYSVDTVSKLTGVESKKIEDIANSFAKAKNPVAVCGKGGRGVSSSSVELIAVYALNDMVKSRAVTLKQRTGLSNIAGDAKKPAGLDEFIKNNEFELLFVNGADPVYKSVLGVQLKEKMKKAFSVSITPIINNTANYSDYILPPLTSFETKGAAVDAAVKPATQAKHAGDIIINIAKQVESIKGSFPWESYVDVIKLTGNQKTVGNKFSFNSDILKNHLSELKKIIDPSEKYNLSLIPVETPLIGDGDGMAFPYALKAVERKTYSHGKLWVMMNRKTADEEGISEGEKIDIISERGEIGSVRVNLTDTVAPGVVAIPLGFGHEAYSKYAEDKGVNPKTIMSDNIDPLSGSANWWTTRVKIS